MKHSKKIIKKISSFIKSRSILGYCDKFIVQKENFGYTFILITKLTPGILTQQISLSHLDIENAYNKEGNMNDSLYLRINSHFNKISEAYDNGKISWA